MRADNKKPAVSDNSTAGKANQTDAAILAAASSASKPPSTLLLPLVVTACTAALALKNAANPAMLRALCASPSGWGRATVRVGAAKHYGSEARKSVGAAAVPNLDSGFFTPMRCAWA